MNLSFCFVDLCDAAMLPLPASQGVGATSRSYHFSNRSSLIRGLIPVGTLRGEVPNTNRILLTKRPYL